MKEFSWNDLKDKNMVICCKNNDESKKLFLILSKYSDDFKCDFIDENNSEDGICYNFTSDGWYWCTRDYYENNEDTSWTIYYFNDIGIK